MQLKRPLIPIAVLNEVAPPENRKDLNRLAALKKADVVTAYNFYSGQEATLRIQKYRCESGSMVCASQRQLSLKMLLAWGAILAGRRSYGQP